MTLVVHPRVASQPGSLRLWVGAGGRTAAPQLTWQLNGRPAQPRELRAMASARPPSMVQSTTERVFCGEYQFDHVGRGVQRVILTADAQRAELRTKAVLPRLSEGSGWFNVLLLSCYHRAEANHGGLRAALARIKKEAPPHMTVLMGDQVYLDLPTLKNFKDNEAWLANKFERDYTGNWMRRGGFFDVLQVAPSICLPDDHEYWNNAPHRATVIQNTWTAAARGRWMRAATALYRAFQAPALDAMQRPFRLDVEPLSFLFADGRSLRQRKRTRAFSDKAMPCIQDWVSDLNARGLVGAFVTGQPVLAEKESWFKGHLVDWALANYGDHATLMRLLGQASNHLFLLTGDVHWGRTAQAVKQGKKMTDIVVSPTALVTTVGGAEGPRTWDFLRDFMGEKERWPRHSDPQAAPRGVAFGAGPRVDFKTKVNAKGDQVAVLSFRKIGGKLESRIKYFHVQQEAERPRSVRLLP